MGEALNEADLLTEAGLETDSDEATQVGTGSVSTMQVETGILIGDFLSALTHKNACGQIAFLG
jgi:hypothetical protein